MVTSHYFERGLRHATTSTGNPDCWGIESTKLETQHNYAWKFSTKQTSCVQNLDTADRKSSWDQAFKTVHQLVDIYLQNDLCSISSEGALPGKQLRPTAAINQAICSRLSSVSHVPIARDPSHHARNFTLNVVRKSDSFNCAAPAGNHQSASSTVSNFTSHWIVQ